ncbi:MAG: type II secretion system F family protein [Sneathiella sp.]
MSLTTDDKISSVGEQKTILNLDKTKKGWRSWTGNLSFAGGLSLGGTFTLLFSSLNNTVLYLGGGLLLTGISVLFYQSRRISKRKEMLSKQFPEALDLMVRGARVGVSAENNIREAATDLPSPIASVFMEMREQLDIGLSFDSVLSDAALKNEIREFRYLAATLSVQRRTGGAYANVLENLSAVLREHQEQNERVDAVTTEAKVSAKVVAGVGVCSCILLFFQNRAQFDFLLNDPTGQYMALYCVFSIGFGLLLIRQMLETLS